MKHYISTGAIAAGIAVLILAHLLSPARAAEAAPPAAREHAAGTDAPAAAPLRVPVTQEQVARLGIKISPAAAGVIRRELRVPGEININSDRIAHVVPRAAGIVREVTQTLGDQVKAGTILAWIESAELAEAKLDFFAKEAEAERCEIRLPRAREIFENVAKLIALLKSESSEEQIRKLDGLEMGQYRGELLPAHAAYLSAGAIHRREAGLHAQSISSGQELLAAETELRTARARFLGAVETAGYAARIAYSEAAQERQVAVFNAVAAEKRLRLKGAEAAVIVALRTLIPRSAGAEPCACPEANCTAGHLPSVADALAQDERFAWYALRAPLDGTLIEKHIVAGESVDQSSELFTIADLSSVWVNLAVSQAAVPLVSTGTPVLIRLPDGSKAAAATDFVAAVIDPGTRTALARATLPNPAGAFRPGSFVDVDIQLPPSPECVIVPKASLQSVHDHPCVFVWSKGAFEMREVTTGYADNSNIEILTGLKAGEAVASVNAFHLKAEVSKSGSGPSCSGHGHAH